MPINSASYIQRIFFQFFLHKGKLSVTIFVSYSLVNGLQAMVNYRFTCSETDISVTVPETAEVLLNFLESYFDPYISVRKDCSKHEPFAYVDIKIEAPPAEAPVNIAEGFEIDVDRSKAFLQCSGRYIDDGRIRWVLLIPSQAIVRVDKVTRKITVWGNSQNVLNVPVLRIIEDLFSSEIERSKGVFLHASGVIANGKAVVAIGNKGAGKTSILCRLLKNFNVMKLANDSIYLKAHKNNVLASGWPAFFKVEIATISSLCELAADFPEQHRDILHDNIALWEVYDKVALYPSQGARRFGKKISVEAPLGAIILPKFSMEISPGLRKISIDEVELELPKYLQGMFNSNHSDWLGLNIVDSQFVLKTLEDIIKLLKSLKVPIYQLNWCPSLDDFLGQVDELRGTQQSLLDCNSSLKKVDEYPPLPFIDLVSVS
jgi:hypothetical protein